MILQDINPHQRFSKCDIEYTIENAAIGFHVVEHWHGLTWQDTRDGKLRYWRPTYRGAQKKMSHRIGERILDGYTAKGGTK